MTEIADLSALSPRARARVIYTQARTEMTDRLWQAAIGRAEDDRFGTQAPCRHERGSGLLAMLDALAPARSSNALVPADAAAARSVVAAAPAVDPAPTEPGAPLAIDPPAEVAMPADAADLAGLGVNAGHAPALARASERSGIPAPALAAIIDAEAAKRKDGSWNLFSRNPRSSAAGLGQFLSGTWIGMAERSGTWLNDIARQKGWLGDNGRVRSGARGALLALRYDAEASINSIADYARTNIGQIRRAGVRIGESAASLAKAAYLGHHLGPGDAVRFLQGGLSEGRAARLLQAQIGSGEARSRISRAGSAAGAHRTWLNAYVSNHVRPDRFGATRIALGT